MNKNVYVAKVLQNGHLSLPPTVVSRLNLKVNSKIRILIIDDTEKRGINRFCGQWQDERNVEDIVSEIFTERYKNTRSETQIL
jgi:hypothetical protein